MSSPYPTSYRSQFCIEWRCYLAVCCAAARSSSVTVTVTSMPRTEEAEPIKVPHNGNTSLGSQATATRIRLRLPIDAIGRIKIYPPGTRQVDLHPRMRCTASYGAASVHIGNKDIATDETSGQTKRTRRFHHQYGKISAATTTTLKRFIWTLYPLLTASCIDKLVLDGQCDGPQQAHGFDGPGRVQKLTHPTSNIIAWVVVGQRTCEVRQFVIRVTEGVGVRILLERIVRQRDFDVLKGHHAVKTQFGSRAVEGRDGNGVVEDIVEPAKTSGSGM